MKKVLVTGASGFIGSHLVEQLCQCKEYEVVAAVSGRRKIVFPSSVQVEQGDLLREDVQESLIKRIRPDICCHFAWSLSDSDFQISSDNLKWLEASLRLLRFFVENGGKKFFFAGSVAEYGQIQRGIAEQQNLVRLKLYGQCKRAFEETAAVFCEQHSIEFIAGRFFTVYGPRDVRPGNALPEAISTMLQGREYVCRSPHNLWDYVYVKDCVEAVERLLTKGMSGSYNIGTGHPLRMGEVFQLAAKELGTEHLLRLADNPDCLMLTADATKLFQETGYRCDTPFTKGIRETVAWWKAREK